MNLKSVLITAAFVLCGLNSGFSQKLKIDENEQFYSKEFSVLVFHNDYSVGRRGSIEMILHDKRIATNIDLRLTPIPIPDAPGILMPEFVERIANPTKGFIQVKLNYPGLGFDYLINLQSTDEGINISVDIKGNVPKEVVGKLSFIMELIPIIYRDKSYYMDGRAGAFPWQFNGLTDFSKDGELIVVPMATGKNLSVAPDDPLRHFTIKSNSGNMDLLDGRASSNHKWFIIREFIPEKGGKNCINWTITPSIKKDWMPDANVGFSQIGYDSHQPKISVIEMNNLDNPDEVSLVKVSSDGKHEVVKKAVPEIWGKYHRNKYARFDFSDIQEEGMYYLEYRGKRTEIFPVKNNLYADQFWRPALETFIPVQMCHVAVRDQLRMWHGNCHADDALQAPAGKEHFDHYQMDDEISSGYKDYEHIPGMNVGGWHDAGDNDLEGPSNTSTIYNLALAYETFGINSDQTMVDYNRNLVKIHEPDGKTDLLQQIEHGTLFVLANYKAYGRYCRGVISPDFEQYLQMGDISAQTDGLIYNPSMAEDEKSATETGRNDDRLVFNNVNISYEFGALNALAIASRVLKGYDDELADESLQTALMIWDRENTTVVADSENSNRSRSLKYYQMISAVELFLCTGEDRFKDIIMTLPEMVPDRRGRSSAAALWPISRVIDQIDDEAFREKFMNQLKTYSESLKTSLAASPYGVPPIHTRFGTGHRYMHVACEQYFLHTKYPDLFSSEPIYNIISYMHGNHPVSNHSLVSGIGTKSITSSYGINRADFSYIPGGVSAGPLLVEPDFIEYQVEDPFFWVQKEYTILSSATYVLMMQAVERIMVND